MICSVKDFILLSDFCFHKMKVNDDWVSAKSFSKLGKFSGKVVNISEEIRSILNANLLYF